MTRLCIFKAPKYFYCIESILHNRNMHRSSANYEKKIALCKFYVWAVHNMSGVGGKRPDLSESGANTA